MTDPVFVDGPNDPSTVASDLLDILSCRPAWMARAACRGEQQTIFFLEPGGTPDEARAICAGCRVSAQCREYGADERHGIWGGLSAQERRAARRNAAA